MPNDLELTEAEQYVLYVMRGPMPGATKQPGGFTTKLIEAMCHADRQNAAKLMRVFPELMQAVSDYKYGDLVERAKYAGKK
jgi:hypothetical protein